MRWLTSACLTLLAVASVSAQTSDNKVVLVLLDGIRWQEVFRGADPDLLNKERGGVGNVEAVKAQFWRTTEDARREALMPFLWGTIAKQGQLLGDRDAGSRMRVANKYHFSYPGYSEMIVGIPDDRINTNDPIPNPNPSVWEFLNGTPEFRGRTTVFSVWDVTPAMVNRDQTKLPVNAALEPLTFGTKTREIEVLNGLKLNLHHPWPKDPYDALEFYTALSYLKTDKPKAMWLTFGETDSFAHEGRYDFVLEAIHRTDRMLGELWATIQSMPEFKDKTTLIISVDHGRGDALSGGWTGHGSDIPGADQTWLAAIGPFTPALGVRRSTPEITTSQIAATVALSVGKDFLSFQPKAAPPIPDVIRKS